MSNVTKPIILNETGEQIVQKLSEIASSNKSFELLLDTKADKTSVSTPYNFKGSTTYDALPTSNNNVNDTYYCTDVKIKYTWNGSGWFQSSLSESDYADELNQLSNEINYLNDFSLSWIQGNYITTDGTILNHEKYSCTDFINVSQISKLTVISFFNSGASISIYDTFNNFIRCLTNASSDKRIVQEIELDARECYIRISCLTDFLNGAKLFINKANYNSLYKKFNLADYLTDTKVYDKNGFTEIFTNWFNTGFIDISMYKRIVSLYTYTFTDIYSYSFFDENENFVSGLLGTSSSLVHYSDIEIPENAKYLRILSSNNNGRKLENSCIIFEVKKEVLIEKNDVEVNNDYLESLLQTVLCIGDSLTEGDYGSYPSGTVNVHKENYPFYLSKLTGCETHNKGRCGYTPIQYWSMINDENTEEKYKIDTTINYDAIYIYLGTNGGLSDTLDSDTTSNSYESYANTNTGRYCSIIEWCHEKFPYAHIFLINLCYNRLEPSFTESTNTVIEKIAEKYNIPIIDIMRESPFTRDNGNIYRPVGYGNTDNNFIYGNTHFGKLGYLTLAKTIAKLTKKEIENNMEDYCLY